MEALVPVTLFGDLTRNTRLFERPTCACFLSVDAGIPTKVARIHLEFLHRLGCLVRIDLRDYCSANPGWTSSVLHSRDAFQRLATFPGLLPVYVTREAAYGPDLCDGLARQLLEITMMLDIWEQVLLRDTERLTRLFRVAVVALRKRFNENVGHSNPVGRIAEHPAVRDDPLGQATKDYLKSVRKGTEGRRFEDYRIAIAGQLRVLFHLALAAASRPISDGYTTSSVRNPDVRRFHQQSVAERSELVEVLDDLLTLGLELPLNERPAELAALLGNESFACERGERSRLYEGEHDWLGWSPDLDPARRGAHAECVVRVLAGMNPELYEVDWIERRARELLPDRVADVLEQRLAGPSRSMPAGAFCA